MDIGLYVLFGLVVLFGANQLLMRVDAMKRNDLAFWSLNAINAGAGAAVLWRGLPGYGHLPAIGWLVGLMLWLHVAQNVQLRGRWLREQRGGLADDRRAR